jgi:hypothetical protein
VSLCIDVEAKPLAFMCTDVQLGSIVVIDPDLATPGLNF